MKYMVIETFKAGKSDEVYARFKDRGRLLPAGLRYIASWLSSDGGTCFQLMEADSIERFDEWTQHWDDLVDFEVTPVVDSPTAPAGQTNRSANPAGDSMVAGLVSHLRTMFSYDDWANRETLASLDCVTSPPPRALEIMAHIVGCQWLWIGRLKLAAQPAEVWPQLTLVECREQLSSLASAWSGLLDELAPHRLDDLIRYTNSLGEDWTSRVQDMLTHVPAHSAYHRGQIATLLGRAGHKPAYTDFIHCVRQGLITLAEPEAMQ